MEVKELEIIGKQKVLEIGSGSHRVDNPNEERSYLDIKVDLLKRQKKWGVLKGDLNTVEADATKTLPFGDGEFNKSVLNFPSGILMNSVIKESGTLWPELLRVLKDDGSVEVTMEENFRNPTTGEIIEKPFELARKAAQSAGFEVEIKRLNRDEVAKIETNQPMVANFLMNDKRNESPFYRVVARK